MIQCWIQNHVCVTNVDVVMSDQFDKTQATKLKDFDMKEKTCNTSYCLQNLQKIVCKGMLHCSNFQFNISLKIINEKYPV